MTCVHVLSVAMTSYPSEALSFIMGTYFLVMCFDWAGWLITKLDIALEGSGTLVCSTSRM